LLTDLRLNAKDFGIEEHASNFFLQILVFVFGTFPSHSISDFKGEGFTPLLASMRGFRAADSMVKYAAIIIYESLH
jgi:hypothetical protein